MGLELPEHNGLVTLLPRSAVSASGRRCSYVLGDADHALRHASCLLNILYGVTVQEKPPVQLTASFSKHVPWLMDSLEALNEEGKRWRELYGYNPAPLLQHALNLTDISSRVEQVVTHKLYATAVLLSADTAEHLNELLIQDEDETSTSRILAMALVRLADVATKQRPISRLIAAQLLKPLERIFTEGHLGESSGDLKVRHPCSYLTPSTPNFQLLQRAISLLREAVTLPSSRPFSAGLSPEAFVDKNIRLMVRGIELKAQPADPERNVKRRKLTQESSSTPLLINRLFRILEVPRTTQLAELEDVIL